MSQHITANSNQVVTNELGEFITVNTTRFRKSLIESYGIAPAGDAIMAARDGAWGVVIGFGRGRVYVGCSDQAAAEKEMERLDWIFAKEYRESNKE